MPSASTASRAALVASVAQQVDLVLLVVAVSPVDAGGRLDAKAFGHGCAVVLGRRRMPAMVLVIISPRDARV